VKNERANKQWIIRWEKSKKVVKSSQSRILANNVNRIGSCIKKIAIKPV